MAFFNKSGGDRGPRPYSGKKPQFGGRGGGGFGGNRGGGFERGGDDRGERTMHTTTCAQCGNECQVPFRPNGTKPVFCNNCFQRDERPERGNFSSSPQQFDRPSFAPSAPAPQKFVPPSVDQFKVQLDMINSKLDRIMKLVSPQVTIEPVIESDDEAASKPKKAK